MSAAQPCVIGEVETPHRFPHNDGLVNAGVSRGAFLTAIGAVAAMRRLGRYGGSSGSESWMLARNTSRRGAGLRSGVSQPSVECRNCIFLLERPGGSGLTPAARTSPQRAARAGTNQGVSMARPPLSAAGTCSASGARRRRPTGFTSLREIADVGKSELLAESAGSAGATGVSVLGVGAAHTIPPVRPQPHRLERLPQQYFTALLAAVSRHAALDGRAARRSRARES